MSHNTQLEQLDDQTVLRILGYLNEDLQQKLPEENVDLVQDETDARTALAALLVATGQESSQATAEQIIPSTKEAAALGRGALSFLLDDETIGPRACQLVANPPESRQMFVEPITGAIVLVALTTWLLTKVKVEGSLKDGKPSGSFSIEKPSVDPATLKAMVQGITTLFKG
jgi:hypothetical protein